MKEELQTKLLEILTAIQTNTGKAIDTGTELAGKAGDFALEQLPDIAQSYLAFARAWETFGALTAWTAFGCGMYLLVQKVFKDETWEDGEARFVAGLAVTVVNLVLATIAFSFTKAALFVWFAPKVWIIQELAKLIGTMKG